MDYAIQGGGKRNTMNHEEEVRMRKFSAEGERATRDENEEREENNCVIKQTNI
jgi:hypothetical protein